MKINAITNGQSPIFRQRGSGAFYAASGTAKRNLYPADRSPLSKDHKNRDCLSDRIVSMFHGKVVSMSLPDQVIGELF
jgi:hypothetical protein